MRVLTISEQGLQRHLEAAHCLVERSDTGEEALGFVRDYEFDIVVTNLRLPDMPGTDLIRRMRERGIETPVLALSPTSRAQLTIAALTAGADDVMELPADPAELIARLRALVRRSRGYSHQVLTAGPVSLDLTTHEVTVQGKPVHLTRMETAVLELLMLRRNVPLSKSTFLHHLYPDADHEPDPKIIDVFVCKTRKKLGQAGAPGMIGTSWGRGYMMRTEPAESRAHSRPSGMLAQTKSQPVAA